MASRLDLQQLLEDTLGSRNVYFQPPESMKIQYPAIVYSRDSIDNDFADDSVYRQIHSYQIIVIDKDPDSEIVDKLSKLPTCKFRRHYKTDNLNHDIFIIKF